MNDQTLLRLLTEEQEAIVDYLGRATPDIDMTIALSHHMTADVATGKFDARESAAHLSDEDISVGYDGLMVDGLEAADSVPNYCRRNARGGHDGLEHMSRGGECAWQG